MTDKDTKDMIKRCIDEIKMLRKLIDHLEPKADAYDKLSIVLTMIPKPGRGYGENIVHRLEEQLSILEKETKTNA